MFNNKIDIVSVGDITGVDFSIPKYQRGYRWESQQVTDLLNDFYDFFIERKETADYSLQPLVVKRYVKNLPLLKQEVSSLHDDSDDSYLYINALEDLISRNCQWEVIDGQQRLTTLYIILNVLKKKRPYNIEYKTRQGSKTYLENKLENLQSSKDNNDYYHMHGAYVAVNRWIGRNFGYEALSSPGNELNDLADCIEKRVKFIWYESVDENPIDVFTRINIGKIALTNAELIKALLLNCTNFKGEDFDSLRLKQLNIAKKWDEIEYSLQKKDFWLFLTDTSESYDTHIDYLFKLLCEQNMLELPEEEMTRIGKDRYRVYRYFSAVLKNGKEIEGIWDKVICIFDTFKEWFNDEFLYHYIGFLIWSREKDKGDKFELISDLMERWGKSTKEEFLRKIKEKIKETIKTGAGNLNKLHFDKDKSKIFKILLLHNIQSVLTTLNVQKQSKYEMNVFYKFPFHLFKSESWNVEHIDSATFNELKTLKEKKAWARAILNSSPNSIDDETRSLLEALINEKEAKNVGDDYFKQLYDKVMPMVKVQEPLQVSVDNSPDCPEDNERMHIWNLTLLDEKTNKSYHNYLFSLKRAFVINKEKGLSCHLNDDGEIELDGVEAAFVPSCTKQVFLKYYTIQSNDLLSWGRKDAKAYLGDIKEKIKDFLY